MRRSSTLLVLVVAARFVLHALYVPAFEGPDEPFHLARTVNVWPGDLVPSAIVGSVKAHPCAADLEHAVQCPPFGATRAAFNVLRREEESTAPSIENYEAHQPPLYYASGKAWLALFAFRSDPTGRLLLMRLFSVLLVLLSAVLFLRPQGDDVWFIGTMLALLVPGASESLARCANDAGVFAWCAAITFAVARNARTYVLAVLALLGPLVKLTSLAIVAFVVAWVWMNRGRLHAISVAAASALFVPVQWSRGYMWGGTLELNAVPPPFHETVAQSAAGFLRSAYTFVKTTYWLGEWSFFRPPVWLLGLTAVYVVVLVLSIRIRGVAQPHAIALAIVTIAIAVFFVSHRRFWGRWGGVGGWYAWGWFPWLAVAINDSIEFRGKRRVLMAGAIVVTIANVAWFTAAHAIYA